MNVRTAPIPRIPASARDLGATKIVRCSARVFAVGYKGENQRDIVDALSKALGSKANVTWDGRAWTAILIEIL